MPWTSRDAYSHTKKASTPALQSRWATVANAHLSKTGDEAAAIKIANAAIASKPSKKGPVNVRQPAPEPAVAAPGDLADAPGQPPGKGMAPLLSAPGGLSAQPPMGGPFKGK